QVGAKGPQTLVINLFYATSPSQPRQSGLKHCILTWEDGRDGRKRQPWAMGKAWLIKWDSLGKSVSSHSLLIRLLRRESTRSSSPPQSTPHNCARSTPVLKAIRCCEHSDLSVALLLTPAASLRQTQRLGK